MADVPVSFAAVDEGLRTAIAGYESEIKELQAVAAKGVLTGSSGTQYRIDPLSGMLRKLGEENRYVGQTAKEAAQGVEEFGQASQRAGINIGGMIERIGVRLAIFEAIRLAIQGVKYVIDELSNMQQTELQFNALSDGADHLAARFQYLKEQAAGALIPPEMALKVSQTLQDYGSSADEASMYVKDLGQWSKILGVDADKLAQSLGRVAQGEGSLQDMRLVTHMMGDQAAAGRQLVQTYENLVKAQKNLEAESAAAGQAMEVMTRAMVRGLEEAERHLERHQKFTEKIITAQTEWDRAHGRETRTPAEVMTQAFEARSKAADIPGGEVMLMPRGGWRGPQIPKAELEEYRQGIAAIAKEQGISQSSVHDLIKQQVLDYRDVLDAAKEAHQDEMRNIQDRDQATKASMELRKTMMRGAVTGAKAAITTELPQAVGAPPTDVWSQYTSSIKGSMDEVKTSIDTGTDNIVKAVAQVLNQTEDTATNTKLLYTLFSGGT